MIENLQTRKKIRRTKRKEKKKFVNNLKNKSDFCKFKKDIPIIDQLKEEMGETKINELFNEKNQILDYKKEFNENVKNFKIDKEKKINKDAMEKSIFIYEKISKDKELNSNSNPIDENLKKLFPKANKISDLYETYEAYEENLDIMDFIKNNKEADKTDNDNYNDKDNLNENDEEKIENKYKDEVNIFVHEYE